jgi:hypothetical protein
MGHMDNLIEVKGISTTPIPEKSALREDAAGLPIALEGIEQFRRSIERKFRELYIDMG